MNQREAMYGRRTFWANCCLWGGIVISILGWVMALWELHGGYFGSCGRFLECEVYFLFWLALTQFVAFATLAFAARSFERGVMGRWLAGWMAVAVLLIPVLGLAWLWFAVTR